MANVKYTDEQRAQALDLYEEVGPGEAARRLHVPAATIASWARRAGKQSDAGPRLQAAVEAARLTREQKREILREKLLDKSLQLIDEMDGEVAFVTKDGTVVRLAMRPSDKKDLATALGLLLDKFRLEVGEATGRTETIGQDEFAAYMLGAREAYESAKAEA